MRQKREAKGKREGRAERREGRGGSKEQRRERREEKREKGAQRREEREDRDEKREEVGNGSTTLIPIASPQPTAHFKTLRP
jgi:hypothetical protein